MKCIVLLDDVGHIDVYEWNRENAEILLSILIDLYGGSVDYDEEETNIETLDEAMENFDNISLDDLEIICGAYNDRRYGNRTNVLDIKNGIEDFKLIYMKG